MVRGGSHGFGDFFTEDVDYEAIRAGGFEGDTCYFTGVFPGSVIQRVHSHAYRVFK